MGDKREIKFRAWDKEKKKFYHESLGMYNHLPVNWQEFYIIQQYTGLKDKNGKEIYEGDLVRCDAFIPGASVEVSYKNGVFSAGFSELYTTHTSIWEVIGNIYENPELLNIAKNKGGIK